MDGNGRWAQARSLPRTVGHRTAPKRCAAPYGGGRARHRLSDAVRLFLGELEAPEREIDDLMGLLRLYLRTEIAELHNNSVRIRIIGDRSRLARDIVAADRAGGEDHGRQYRPDRVLALSYGGRQDITHAAQMLAREAAAGRIDPDAIDEVLFSRYLTTADIPDPDLLIRTSGEKRISNFLLWQLAYTEFVFLDVLWPDFDGRNLAAAVEEFRRRDRRYGATVSSS